MNLSSDCQIRHHFADGQYIKETRIPAGYELGKHTHAFSHFSILAEGSAILTVDGAPQLLKAPAIVNVAAGAMHSIRALTAITWLCTHALSESEFDTDPEKIDAIIIAKGA